MMNQVLKWALLLCLVSLIVNGLLYWGTGNREVLINIFGSAGLGVLSAIGLIARKKQ